MWGEEEGRGGGGKIINKSPRGVETGGTAALPNTCDPWLDKYQAGLGFRGIFHKIPRF